MIGRGVLEALLERIADSVDGVVYVSEEELRTWPKGPVAALKEDGLLCRASPGTSATCDGCEQRCHMPVEVLDYGGQPAAFIFCDKPIEVGRVEVPLVRLNRWQACGEAVAALLARKLEIQRSPASSAQPKAWAVGILRDRRSAPIVLRGDGGLAVELAGHVVPLDEVLLLTGKALTLRRQELIDCVNNPAAGGGSRESGTQRRARILARCESLKAQGFRNFRAIVAAEEDRSPETIKKILEKARTSR